MKTTSAPRMLHRRVGYLVAALLCLDAMACFRGIDLSKVKCLDDSNCPSGYSCRRLPGEPHGTCTPGTFDASPAEQPVLLGPDGGVGVDGIPPIDSAGETKADALRDVAMGDTGGTTDGASDAVDTPLGTGGTTGAGGSSGGGTSGGTGGVMDAPIGTGGATSSPDGPVVSPDGPVVPIDAGLAKGSPCTGNAQCASTYCIDGVCCATACTGCRACSAAMTGGVDGTCAPVATGKDPHDTCTDETTTKPCGNDGTCDGKEACRKVASGQKCATASCSADGNTFTPDSKCDGAGTCVAGTPQNCSPYQCAAAGCARACTKQSDCDTGTYCDTTAGTCANQKTNGTPAAQTYECSSGIIADGVCCNEACTAACKACTSALNGQATTTTGTCLPVTAAKATAAHTGCAAGADSCGTDGTCDGVGNCHYPATGSDCGTPSCNLSTSMLTKSTCSSSHVCTPAAPAACPGAAACLANGSGCRPTTCSTDGDCASGNFCAGGACTGKYDNGHSCTAGANNQCKNGNCVGTTCCATPCGECHTCANSTGTCNLVGVGSACSSGVCNALGTCNACSQGSVCTDGIGECQTGAIECSTGQPVCKPTNKSPGTLCGSGPACSGTNSYGHYTCQSGTCTRPSLTTCPSTGCNATTGLCNAACGSAGTAGPVVCGTGCCASNQFCQSSSSNSCGPTQPNGGTCTYGDAQCTSGHCVGGYCCSAGSCASGETCSSGSCVCPTTTRCSTCLSWNFEWGSNASPWVSELNPNWGTANGTKSVSITSMQEPYGQGTHSLLVDIGISSAANTAEVAIQLPCAANLAGLTFSGWVYMSGPALNQWNDNLMAETWNGATFADYQPFVMGGITTGSWFQVFANFTSTTLVNRIGVRLISTGDNWTGQMYLDDWKLY